MRQYIEKDSHKAGHVPRMECNELSPKVVGHSPSEQTKPRSGKELTIWTVMGEHLSYFFTLIKQMSSFQNYLY